MGLLDQLTGDLSRGSAGQVGTLPAAVKALLGGGGGGLGDLVQRFESAGLGNVIGSWIGNGPNQSIAPQDLRKALGDDKVQQASAQTGLSANQLLPLLAQFLPGIIDRLTPGGTVPQGEIHEEQVAKATPT